VQDVYLRDKGITTSTSISKHIVSKRDSDLHKWMRWLVLTNQPLSSVDSNETRGVMTMEKVSSKSLKNLMSGVHQFCLDEMRDKVPDKFCLVFDGWSCGSTHYIATVISYVGHNNKPLEEFLTLSPLCDGTDMSAKQHQEDLRIALSRIDKTFRNVVALIGDNCSVNKKLARDIGIPLVGCASHRFNLAVSAFLDGNATYAPILTKVNDVMVKLRTLKNAAKLRELTALVPVKKNETRWTGWFDMCQRYKRLLPHIELIPEVEEYLLTSCEKRTYAKLLEELSNFYDVTIYLQTKGLSLGTAKDLFQGVLEKYDDNEALKKYLSPNADIVLNKHFESGVHKLWSDVAHTLDPLETDAVKTLEIAPPEEDANADVVEPVSFVSSCLGNKRIRTVRAQPKYLSTAMVLGTSVSVERLFSQAKYVLTDHRRRMSNKVFETILFLKVNVHMWDEATIHLVLLNIKESSRAARERTAPHSSDTTSTVSTLTASTAASARQRALQLPDATTTTNLPTTTTNLPTTPPLPVRRMAYITPRRRLTTNQAQGEANEIPASSVATTAVDDLTRQSDSDSEEFFEFN